MENNLLTAHLDKNGLITCTTCHDIHKEDTTSNKSELSGLLWGHLNGRAFCSLCHTSEATNTNWQHQTAIPYAHSYGKLVQTADGTQLDKLSTECLSCHDGTISQFPQITVKQGIWQHEIGESHPIGVDYPRSEEFTSPEALPKEIRLFDGKIGCLSCHEVYDKEYKMLSMTNRRSRLCLTCHKNNTMPNINRNKRKLFFIKRNFQIDFIISFVALLFMEVSISGIFIYRLSAAAVENAAFRSHITINRSAQIIGPIILKVNACGIIVSILLAGLAMAITYRRNRDLFNKITAGLDNLRDNNPSFRIEPYGGKKTKSFINEFNAAASYFEQRLNNLRFILDSAIREKELINIEKLHARLSSIIAEKESN
jgi:hypothetical protein